MASYRVIVPATIGNLGPGFDVLGLAVDGLADTLTFTFDKNDDQITADGRDHQLLPTGPTKNAAWIAARHFLQTLNHPSSKQGIHIAFQCQLPLAGGLGSSAAASVAGALAAAQHSHQAHHEEPILRSALAGEAACGGAHLDNIAPCLWGGLTSVLSLEPPVVIRHPIMSGWWLSLLTADAQLPTKKARAILPPNIPRDTSVLMTARSLGVVTALCRGDVELLRQSLIDPYAEPARASFIPDFYAIKNAAYAAGAIACTISGAGPTIFAISAAKDLAVHVLQEMKKASSHPVKLSHVGPVALQGARCD